MRAGKLILGEPNSPLTRDVHIELMGGKDNEAVFYDTSIDSGNKNIIVTGRMQAYGIKRDDSRMSRLTQPALKGSSSFFVEPDLDWVEGDRLALLPTSYHKHSYDELVVVSYDGETGEVVADSALNYYHFGREQSTGDLYSGLDMRGEVVLLTRNIRITGERLDNWGG